MSSARKDFKQEEYKNIELPDLFSALAMNHVPDVTDDEIECEREKLEKEKQEILEQARREADEIVRQAKEEASKIQQEAYQEGYAKGEEQGTKEGRERAYTEYKEELNQILTKALEDVETNAQDIRNAKQRVLEEYLDDLKNISLAIGEKIVQTSLRSSGEVVKNMILSATSKLKKNAWAKIYIAMHDENKAREIQGDAEFLLQLSRIADNVKVIVMENAQEGTCILELPNEVIDISVGTQMENITEILNNARV